jgi:hypothetical protein
MLPLAIVILVIDIVAIMSVTSSRKTPGAKSLWIAAIVILPVLGAVAWVLGGQSSRYRSKPR